MATSGAGEGRLRKDRNGRIVFPFDAVHVNFMLTA
jgi:hypothetical protein